MRGVRRENTMSDDRVIEFMGYKWTLDQYDDRLAARAYASKFFYYRLSAFEKRILIEAGPVVSTTDHWKAKRIWQFMEERDGHVDDDAVLQAYGPDRSRILCQVFDRLLDENLGEINRCIKCKRVLRTWSAVRCPWCKSSWTKDEVENPLANPRPELDSR
jgi:hypothetical protein